MTTVPGFAADLAVMAGASVLLLAGCSKIVSPRPIAATLALLWNTVNGRARVGVSPPLGRLLGAGEVALAAAMVMHRSWTVGVALAVFAVGLSAAGVAGVLSGQKLPCACFGKADRALGYPHILQLPLWVAAAAGVTRAPWLFGAGTRLERSLAMLAACAAISTAVHVTTMWRAVYPLARSRRRRADGAGMSGAMGAGASSW